jgi:hypothetical protein
VFQSVAEALPPCRTSFVGKMVPLSLIAVALLSLVHILRDLIRPGNVLTSRCHKPTLPWVVSRRNRFTETGGRGRCGNLAKCNTALLETGKKVPLRQAVRSPMESHIATMPRMATTNPVEQQTWIRWSSYAYSIGLILWVAASALLGIPHGPGHSIESMKPLETMRDVSLPLWVGGLAGIAGALALQTLDRFGRPAGGEGPIVRGTQPLVRKEWLIAMGIVFVALMALVFATCSTRVG